MSVRVEIPDELEIQINSAKSKYQSTSSFVCCLVEDGLLRLRNPISMDKAPALGNSDNELSNSITLLPEQNGPCLPAEQPSLVIHDTNGQAVSSSQESFQLNSYTAQKTKKSAVKTEYTPAFDAFWKVYQSAPNKANRQSKPLAFKEYKKALSCEPAERLIEAARRAVKLQTDASASGEWIEPLPDCFRWIRDGQFIARLELNETAKPTSTTPAAPKWEAGNQNPYAVFN